MKGNVHLVVIALMLAACGAGCASEKYILGAQQPDGMHCMYERNSTIHTSVTTRVQGKTQDHTYESSWTDNLLLAAINVPDSNERMLLREVTNLKFIWSLTDGKPDNTIPKDSRTVFCVEAVAVNAVGEASEPRIITDIGSYPGYFVEKIFALPTRPMKVGDEWSVQLDQDGCRADVQMRLEKVSTRNGKHVALVTGKGKITAESPEENTHLVAELTNYVREIDLDTHATIHESYVFRMHSKWEDNKADLETKVNANLLKCSVVDNEKWQPGVTEFARALIDDGSDPRKAIAAQKTIMAFGRANPDAPLGQYAQWYSKMFFESVGKNVWDFLSFSNDAQWFKSFHKDTHWLNTPGLKKKDLEGKVFILEFWDTECGSYMNVAPEISRLYDELGPKGLVVVGVLRDTKQSAEQSDRFLKVHGVKYPIYWDHTGKLAAAFCVRGLAATILVGRDGTILWQGDPRCDEKFMRELILSVLNEKSDKSQETSAP